VLKRFAVFVTVVSISCAAANADDENVRFYSIVDAPVDVAFDGGAPVRIPAETLYYFKVEPGEHTVTIKAADGQTVQIQETFSEDDMATRWGRKWWCILANTPGGKLELHLTSKTLCQKLLDVAPDEDKLP
jgi:hypothetical protein